VVLLPPGLVLVEPAPGQHHPEPSTHVHRSALTGGPHTDHPVVLDHELLQRRLEPERCLLLLDDDVEERRGKGRTDAGDSLSARDGAERAEDELRAAHEATGGRPCPAEEPDVVRLDRHGHGRLAGVPPRADPLDVEGLHLDGAADLAARQLGVVVRVVTGSHQLDAMLLGGGDEVGHAVDEGLLAGP